MMIQNKDKKALVDVDIYSTSEISEKTCSHIIKFLDAWDCFNCHTLNSLTATSCRICGLKSTVNFS